ncbi:LD-carboxypeptidase [Acidaminobacter sp. JC074]|uniref:S66 family peptidase n=1 Tax=Acidaminobacter sp. JC074 TaxID=2530199 RepID=UPI001F108419|nr:S66 peptidase family protein [Acidaminobacter sp. JC074]MCH4889736.1 LD-carboxypeptidase [Acidaminobacter sp. JC074]
MIIEKNSKIAIIAPSSGAATMFPDVFQSGLDILKKMDYECVLYPTCKMTSRDLYENPELRAKDLNDAFLDPSIKGIVCAIGGYESIRILNHLAIDEILKHPKPIMGFSDATTFLSYLNALGMTTYYGPSVMAGFAQMDEDIHYLDNIKKFLQVSWDEYTLKLSDYYVDGYKDWFKYPNKFLERKTPYAPFESFGGDFEGKLFGGCIEVLEFMKGTKYWPELDFFNDKILFFETSEEKPTPDQVGYFLRNYATQGILNRVSGVIFGRFKDYSEEDYERVKKIILDIYEVELKIQPKICFNLMFGHTDPKWILPLGMHAKVDTSAKSLIIKRL